MSEAEITGLLFPERVERLRQVIDNRTRQLSVLVEAIHKGHNQSAILRNCDAFGLQDAHVIEPSQSPFVPKRSIAMGAQKWMDLYKYPDAKSAVAHLKSEGYQLWASVLDERSVPIDKIDLTGRVVLVFGNEKIGISPELAEACDGNFVVPMQGFAQSFNVSAAVAISLYEAVRQRLARYGTNGDLSEEEKRELFDRFIELSIPNRTLNAVKRRFSISIEGEDTP